jgi:hypothetical protein
MRKSEDPFCCQLPRTNDVDGGDKPGHDATAEPVLNPARAITTAAGTMPQTPSLKDFRRIVVKVATQMGTRGR